MEPAVVPEFGEGTSSAAKTKETIAIVQRTEEPAIIPKVPSVKVVETKVDKADKPETEETTKMPEVLSPPVKATVPKVQMGSAVTPKRRRMVKCTGCARNNRNLESRFYRESCRSSQGANRS
jgi:hypothetical protein